MTQFIIFPSRHTVNKILDHCVSNGLNCVSICTQKLYLKNSLPFNVYYRLVSGREGFYLLAGGRGLSFF